MAANPMTPQQRALVMNNTPEIKTFLSHVKREGLSTKVFLTCLTPGHLCLKHVLNAMLTSLSETDAYA
jgi:hypothetical protein